MVNATGERINGEVASGSAPTRRVWGARLPKRTGRSGLVRLGLGVGLALATVLAPPAALAGPNSPGSTTGLSLVYEYRSGYPPNECYHEDSIHTRSWAGSLNPGESFRLSLPFCTSTQYRSGPGAAGFMMEVSGSGTFTATATSPSGVVYQAHLVSTTNNKQTWKRCNLQPSFNATTQTGTGTIEPGVWTLVFTNTSSRLARDVGVKGLVSQAVSSRQQTNCPSQDWNFR
jgi:hypothetical protein